MSIRIHARQQHGCTGNCNQGRLCECRDEQPRRYDGTTRDTKPGDLLGPRDDAHEPVSGWTTALIAVGLALACIATGFGLAGLWGAR